MLEMEDDSMSLSQASLDERLEASEKNDPDLEGKLYLTECVRVLERASLTSVCIILCVYNR